MNDNLKDEGFDAGLKEKNLLTFSRLIAYPIKEKCKIENSDIQIVTDSRYTYPKIGNKILNSKYAPVKEAEKLIEKAELANADVCVFFGLGGGYHIEEFLRKNNAADVILIEPKTDNLLSLASLRDFSFLNDNRVRVFCYETLDDRRLFSALLAYPDTGIRFFSLSAYKDFYKSQYEHISTLVDRIRRARNTNKNTAKKFGKRWIRNAIRNLPFFIDAHGLELVEKRLPYPAIILGAGPSLEKIEPYIGDIKKRMLVIATDTALRWCRKNDFLPDFIVSVDPQYWNSRHLDAFPVHDSILVSDPAVYPSVMHKKDISVLFINSSLPVVSFFSKMTRFKLSLAAGGSVATSAWDLARLCGSEKIFLAGIDLAFPDRRLYYRGALAEEYALTQSCRTMPASSFLAPIYFDASPRREKCLSGYTYTNARMDVYKSWFEVEVGTRDFPITLRLTNGGVDIAGIAYTSPEDFMSLPQVRDKIDTIVDDIKDNSKLVKNYKLATSLIDEMHTFVSAIRNLANKGLKMLTKEDISDALFFRIDELIFSIKKNPAFYLINLLVQDVMDNLCDGSDVKSIAKNYELILRAISDSACVYIKEIESVKK